MDFLNQLFPDPVARQYGPDVAALFAQDQNQMQIGFALQTLSVIWVLAAIAPWAVTVIRRHIAKSTK